MYGFTADFWDDYLYWQTQDKKTLKKINQLIKDIMRNPYEGLGHPEELTGDLSGFWSRRINQKDRLVYQVDNEQIKLIQCRTHYNDK